jgi:hypothetical protein
MSTYILYKPINSQKLMVQQMYLTSSQTEKHTSLEIFHFLLGRLIICELFNYYTNSLEHSVTLLLYKLNLILSWSVL